MRKKILLVIPILVTTLFFSCTQDSNLPEPEKQWLLVPQEFSGTLFAGYSPKKATHGQTYFYKKTGPRFRAFPPCTPSSLLTAAARPSTLRPKYRIAGTSMTRKRPSAGTTRSRKRTKKILKSVDAQQFGADDVLLLQSESLFYLALRKGLVVYFLQIENVKVDLEPIKEKIFEKIRFIENNTRLFRTDK